MKQLLLLIISAITLASCQQNSKTDEMSAQDYLSVWFKQNEDGLHKEFTAYVVENSLCKTCDTSWGEMAFQNLDSTTYMGRFSLAAKKYCDNIEVTYFYNRYTNPTTRILLSPNYNRKCVGALDSIFKDLTISKYFKVEKYEQPETGADVLSFQNGDVVVKDIRVKASTVGYPKDLTVYINTTNLKLITEVEESLPKILFGEELLLKKFDKIRFEAYQELDDSLFTVEQARDNL